METVDIQWAHRRQELGLGPADNPLDLTLSDPTMFLPESMRREGKER